MDGTALGILGKLPVFERVSSIVAPVARISKRQFTKMKPKNRAFVDWILISARKIVSEAEFTSTIAPKLRSVKCALFQMFFGDSLVE